MGLLLTGITYEEARRKWLARAGTGEDRYHVGRYETEEEAAAALRAEQERRQRAELEDPIGWRLRDARWVNFGSGPDEMAGSVEYEMGGCEPSDSTTVCAEADANATASKTSTVNGALATLPLLRGCARRVDGPAADRHHVRESPGEVAGAGRYQ